MGHGLADIGVSLASVCWLALFGVRASPDAIPPAQCGTEAMAVRAQIVVVNDDHGFRAFPTMEGLTDYRQRRALVSRGA